MKNKPQNSKKLRYHSVNLVELVSVNIWLVPDNFHSFVLISRKEFQQDYEILNINKSLLVERQP